MSKTLFKGCPNHLIHRLIEGVVESKPVRANPCCYYVHDSKTLHEVLISIENDKIITKTIKEMKNND